MVVVQWRLRYEQKKHAARTKWNYSLADLNLLIFKSSRSRLYFFKRMILYLFPQVWQGRICNGTVRTLPSIYVSYPTSCLLRNCRTFFRSLQVFMDYEKKKLSALFLKWKVNSGKYPLQSSYHFFFLCRSSLRADQKSQVVDDWWLVKIFFQEVRRPFTVLNVNCVDTKIHKKAKDLFNRVR